MPVIPTRSDASDIPTSLRTYVSTHTSDKPYNIGLYQNSFPYNRYVVGTDSGVSVISIEPIFGNFPDLSASVYGRGFYESDILTSIFGYMSDSSDISASILGVIPRININKVRLDFVYFKHLSASITAIGQIESIRGSITSLIPAHTNTADDAKFISVISTTRKYVATTKGLLIFDPVVGSEKTTLFLNYTDLPDLRSVLHGWAVSDFGASIIPSLQKDMPASMVVFDASHMSNMAASILTYDVSDVSASVTASGDSSDIGATLSPKFLTSILGASINGYLGVSGREIITIHTKPIKDLSASINFDETYSCARRSGYYDMRSSVIVNSSGQVNISAVIEALANKTDVSASITGINRVRVRLLNISFRARTRDSVGMSAYIRGWSDATEKNLSASVSGLYQAVDLSSSLNVVRYKPADFEVSDVVNLVDISNPAVQEYADVLFGSGVDSYIFNPADNRIYSEDSAQWSVLIRQVVESSGFVPTTTSKRVYVRGLEDYDSLDEAIRASLSKIINPYNSDMGCTITCAGSFRTLTATLSIISADRILDMPAKIVESSIPDIQALITASGGHLSLATIIKSVGSSESDVVSYIIPVSFGDISSTITGV